MDISILNSILHGELAPWLIDTKTKSIAEKLKGIGDKPPITLSDLKRQIESLIRDFPGLSSTLQYNTSIKDEELLETYYITDFPQYHDAITKFYSLLISKETNRLFNEYTYESLVWKDRIDVIYRTTTLLRQIKTLAKQVHHELARRGYIDAPATQSGHIHFTLYYLLLHLITLFFSIQEVQKNTLEEIISLEDFFLLELSEATSHVIKMYASAEKPTIQKTPLEKVENLINFGFKGKKEALKAVLNQLNYSIELINENQSSVDDLVSALTSKALLPGSVSIYLGCETAIFRDVLDRLKLKFSNLSLISVERSKIFFSKKGTLLTAQNLSSSKIENSKSKEDIERIFQHWQ